MNLRNQTMSIMKKKKTVTVIMEMATMKAMETKMAMKKGTAMITERMEKKMAEKNCLRQKLLDAKH